MPFIDEFIKLGKLFNQMSQEQTCPHRDSIIGVFFKRVDFILMGEYNEFTQV